MSIEAMKQALEKIATVSAMDYEYQRWAREALAATEESSETQEPVAWRFKTATFWNREPHWRYVLSLDGTEGLRGLEPLYTHPQPKREWVGLTDEERNKIRFDHLDYDERASAIEAKLKEKNT